GPFVPGCPIAAEEKELSNPFTYGGMYIMPLLMMKWPVLQQLRFYRAFFIKIRTKKLTEETSKQLYG
ncbi:hypothetical protein RCO48_00740, partial [Peribacillus frigoritolerans]|nr:hypothetical protein [Peribacillus frigoritolerans]